MSEVQNKNQKKGMAVKKDHDFMQQALKEAYKAFEKNEVPIGAIVVDKEGALLGVGHNLVETKRSQIAHAEVEAIEQATDNQGDWRLQECTLYVTLEPCNMCIAAIKLSRIQRVVYGADSPLFGFKKDYQFNKSPYDGIAITSGVQEKECADLLKTFFEEQRIK